MKSLDVLTAVLLVIGGINWGLFGAFGLDLVELLFGPLTILSRTVYVLVGLSAAYQLVRWRASAAGGRVSTPVLTH
jgi:uncharacterized protein